jgi:hypothetical protein
MKKSTIIYSLNIEDVQTVANDDLERNLSHQEIEKVKEKIAEKIDWYNAISNSIRDII